jgi:hypothetical protein
MDRAVLPDRLSSPTWLSLAYWECLRAFTKVNWPEMRYSTQVIALDQPHQRIVCAAGARRSLGDSVE